MSYIDIYERAEETVFLQKLSVAVLQKARNLYAPGGIDLTQFEDALAVYAGPSTQDFHRFAAMYAFFVLAVDPTLTVESTDADFLAAVEGAWLPYAEFLAAKGIIDLEATA